MKLRHGDKIFIIIAGMIISIMNFDAVVFGGYTMERLTVSVVLGMLFYAVIPWSIYRVVLHYKTKRIKNALQHT